MPLPDTFSFNPRRTVIMIWRPWNLEPWNRGTAVLVIW
jgi:hypothetical protein